VPVGLALERRRPADSSRVVACAWADVAAGGRRRDLPLQRGPLPDRDRLLAKEAAAGGPARLASIPAR